MKMHAYISNIEDYLAGSYDYAFTLYVEKDDWNKRPYIGVVDVDISKVNNYSLTQSAINIVAEEEEKTRAEFEVKMGLLNEKKQKFLSITHQPERIE